MSIEARAAPFRQRDDEESAKVMNIAGLEALLRHPELAEAQPAA
jgi:hypothetical protein